MAQGWGPRLASSRRGTVVSTDPGNARGETPGPLPPLYGQCGHLIAAHDIKKDGTRGACSHMDGDTGQCGCKGCPPAEAGQ